MSAQDRNKSRRDGASESRTGWLDQVHGWRQHHRSSARDSLLRLLKSPVASLMTWLVIGVAMALPVGLSVALDNARNVSSAWDSPAQVSLFLRPEMSLDAARGLARELQERADIVETRIVPQDEALAEFQQLSGFGDVLRNLDDNPLPNLIIVFPAQTRPDREQAQRLQQALETEPGVDRAVLDMEWVQRLNSLMSLSQRLVSALGIILALAVLLVIGNTIRLAIENRRDEIVIIKLVGGSDPFVRRPFLYTGLWFGLGGAIVAWIVISLTLWWLRGPLATLAQLYQSSFQLSGLGWQSSLILLGAGCLLGLGGAWLSVTRHLQAIRP